MTEEAKRVVAGLRYCYRHIHCYSIKDGERCPDYDSCQKKVADNVSRNDALADLIESLSAQLEQVEKERDGLNIMLAQAQAMLETRTKERDAAIRDIAEAAPCFACIRFERNGGDCIGAHVCIDDILQDALGGKYADHYWQWRGVEVEG